MSGTKEANFDELMRRFHDCTSAETAWAMGVLHLFSFKTPIIDAKNKKKCKINSRNFTYDGLTFSCSSFVLEQVKDEI